MGGRAHGIGVGQSLLLRRENHSRRVSRRLGPGACALAGVGRKGPAVEVSPEAWPWVQQNAANGLIQLNLARVAFRPVRSARPAGCQPGVGAGRDMKQRNSRPALPCAGG